MDLQRVGTRMRLDLLAVQAIRALEAAAIPCVLLKGPSTAVWLYDPPRDYRDVDLLVPYELVEKAADVLVSAGVARRTSRMGEEAEHSMVLVSPAGFELDLHVTLPMLSLYRPPRPPEVWATLQAHLASMTLLDGEEVTVLDVPGRLLVLSLHALASGYQHEIPVEDLRRALAAVRGELLERAHALAGRLQVRDRFEAGLRVTAPSTVVGPGVVDAALKSMSAKGSAHGFQRIADAPWRARMAIIWRELFPSRQFLERSNFGHVPLWKFRITRLRRIWRELPSAHAQWRLARKPTKQRWPH